MFEIILDNPQVTIHNAIQFAGGKQKDLADKLKMDSATISRAKKKDKLPESLLQKFRELGGVTTEDQLQKAPPEGQTIAITRIEVDDEIQQRVSITESLVAEYADILRTTEEYPFPPVTVFRGTDDILWLADGFHRVAAAIKAEIEHIPVEIREGEFRDAMLHAVGANALHGLRRSNEDKRRAVTTMLEDEEWSQWSDREIARQCKVSHPLVSNIRSELTSTGNPSSEAQFPEPTKKQGPESEQAPAPRKTRDGRTMNTANIGKANKNRKASPPPKKKSKALAAQQTLDRLAGICSDIRKVELTGSETHMLATYLRDQLVWVIPKLPSQEVNSTLVTIQEAAAEICGE